METFIQAMGIPGMQAPAPGDLATYARRAARGDDATGTVGLALLAYGLVQLLSKFIDKIGLGRDDREVRYAGFDEEDRKRLARVCELLTEADQRLQRIGEVTVTQQRLVGQALDELREATKRHESLARKLNAVWTRIGSRNGDRK